MHIPASQVNGKPRYILCGLLQALWLMLWSAGLSVLALLLVMAVTRIYMFYPIKIFASVVTGFALLGLPVYLGISIMWAYIVKKVFLGRVKPGAYSLWSMYYLRWWIARQAK